MTRQEREEEKEFKIEQILDFNPKLCRWKLGKNNNLRELNKILNLYREVESFERTNSN